MQRLEVSGAVRPIYGSLGFKGLIISHFNLQAGAFSYTGEELMADTGLQVQTQPTVALNTWAKASSKWKRKYPNKYSNVWMARPANVVYRKCLYLRHDRVTLKLMIT